MLAERRDLIVATYSSVRGTGERSTVSTFTGNALGAGCFASVLAHPAVNKIARAIKPTHKIRRSLAPLFMSRVPNTIQKMICRFVEIQKPRLAASHSAPQKGTRRK